MESNWYTGGVSLRLSSLLGLPSVGIPTQTCQLSQLSSPAGLLGIGFIIGYPLGPILEDIHLPALDGLLRTTHRNVIIQYPPHEPHVFGLEGAPPGMLSSQVGFLKNFKQVGLSTAPEGLDGLIGKMHLHQLSAELSN